MPVRGYSLKEEWIGKVVQLARLYTIQHLSRSRRQPIQLGQNECVLEMVIAEAHRTAARVSLISWPCTW